MFLVSEAARTASASFERPVDLVHLARQTLGDRALESEILGLFVVQTRNVIERMRVAADGRSRMELAHTLKGSARAVGAWQVAAAAEACEGLQAASEQSWLESIDRLTEVSRQAWLAIAELVEAGSTLPRA